MVYETFRGSRTVGGADNLSIHPIPICIKFFEHLVDRRRLPDGGIAMLSVERILLLLTFTGLLGSAAAWLLCAQCTLPGQ
jgi:hypothetical protein